MKKLFMALMLLIFANSYTAQAETMTPDQTAIVTLLKKMYAIDPDEFDYATFGAKYKNGDEVVAGKYDPPRQCRLLAEFLSKEAIIKEKGINSGCMTGDAGNFRYPGIDDEDLAPLTRLESLPKPHINTPVIQGDKAKVYVIFKDGRNVFYYLKNLPEGWRIYKVESRTTENWRSDIKEVRERDDIVNVFPPEKSSK
ncbi:hypothetical protein [Sulfuriferula thiophila]|uniref:hypothetical protein n=1 Tax=Sulfuriferula thiophila TaxID=1781211 RepID=UPI000F609164|nr:hypothetical protein [Sulfuriferula thiophila]